METKNIFMTGNWEDLIISTFEVDKNILQKYLPNGTEIDLFNGKALLSMVAFTFSKVKFFGIKIPLHQLFGQINFRFYVKSNVDGRKGVVFIKEFAPKPLIALIANKIYNEPFFVKNIKRNKATLENNLLMEYNSPYGKVQAIAENETNNLKENTLEHFIVDRYIAFVKSKRTKTYQYKISHKPWKLYKTVTVKIDDTVLKLLPQELQMAKLVSTYFVDGSSITVEKGILQQETDNNSVIVSKSLFLSKPRLCQ